MFSDCPSNAIDVADSCKANMIAINLRKYMMRIFVCCLLLIPFVTGNNMQALSGIKTQTFTKINCQDGSTSVLPGYTTVRCRSSIRCAGECIKTTCKSYRYDKTTSECRLSYGDLDVEKDNWFCAPFYQVNHCFPPFLNFRGHCIIHKRRRNPLNTYGDIKQECTDIGGQLYRIEQYQFLRTHILMTYAFENLLRNYAIQGRPFYDFLMLWLTDDNMIAADSLFIFGDILAVDGFALIETGINVADVNGVICEPTTSIY